jgi:hypothetical protein
VDERVGLLTGDGMTELHAYRNGDMYMVSARFYGDQSTAAPMTKAQARALRDWLNANVKD